MPWPALDPATGRIACDLPCIGCEYNLRTLRADGRCPECGKEVADSIRASDPIALHSRWTTMIKDGLEILLLGVSFLSVAVVTVLMATMTGGSDFGLLTAVFVACLLLGLFLLAIGTFVVIGARPSSWVGQGLRKTRIVFFVGIPGTVMLIICAIMLSPIWWVSASVAVLALACAGSIPMSFSYYCRQLAFRYPIDRLRKTATVAVWATALCVSTLALQLFMFILEEAWEISFDTRVKSALSIVAVIIFLGELPLHIVFFYKLRAALNRFS